MFQALEEAEDRADTCLVRAPAFDWHEISLGTWQTVRALTRGRVAVSHQRQHRVLRNTR